jgi:glycosyltransferase involved in cell wall biosynthesis
VKLLFLTQVIDADDAVLGFVTRWVEGFAARCERVRVVALEAGNTSTLPANVDVRVVGRKGTITRWLRYRAILSEALQSDGFDVVLAHMVPRYALLAAGPAKRSGARLFLWYTHAGVDARLRRAISRVEKVFTASSESLRLDTDKRVVTGHGIDLRHFENRAEGPAVPNRLLAVGRLSKSKDPITILTALSILVARGHDLYLDLVGGGLTVEDEGYMRAIQEAIEVGGVKSRVHLPGEIPYRDIASWYARSSVVVNSSLTGSVDKVVLEGWASARPVVSCNDAIPPLLAEFGNSANDFCFEPGNASALADRIERILVRPPRERAAIGERLRAIVARDHEVERLMDRLVVEMGGAR